jgi:hypothetical protein
MLHVELVSVNTPQSCIARKIPFMSRPARTIAALFVLVTMLFSQLAVAAHLCPMMMQTMTPTEMSAEDMLPCHAAEKSTALCKEHCTENQRTVVDAFAQLPITFVPTFAVPVAALEDTSVIAPRSPDFGLVHTLGPPLTITLCCLRV